MAKPYWNSIEGSDLGGFILTKSEPRGKGTVLWLECSVCGETRSVHSNNLYGMRCRSCGNECLYRREKGYEMSFEEIASCLGVSPQTVRTDYERALKKLRKALSALGYTASDASEERLLDFIVTGTP